jgi:DNA helicase-2/ATP-dependent DNA helicase PcrA
VRSQHHRRRDGDWVGDDGEDDEGDIGIGDRILHSTFGPGWVLELSGRPGSEEALIDFDETGTKRLLLAYAPLVRA